MIVDEERELENLADPDELPQEIVEWQSKHGRLIETPKVSTGFFAAAALGAVAVGALAIGALAIGSLAVGRARVRRLRIDDLEVGRLRIQRD
jgi:hypothetical protein